MANSLGKLGKDVGQKWRFSCIALYIKYKVANVFAWAWKPQLGIPV